MLPVIYPVPAGERAPLAGDENRKAMFRWRLWLQFRVLSVGVIMLGVVVVGIFAFHMLFGNPSSNELVTAKSAADAAVQIAEYVRLTTRLETTPASNQRADAVYIGDPLSEIDDELELPSPIRGDSETFVLKNIGSAADPEWTWPDTCDNIREQAGTWDFQELRRRAVGPLWSKAVEKMPQSGSICIGPEKLPFFRESLTFRHKSTLLYGGRRDMRWNVDTDFASYSNLSLPSAFVYLTEPQGLCQHLEQQEPTTLFLTLSQLKESAERQLIRTYLPLPDDMRRVFLVGHPVEGANYMTRCEYRDCAIDTSWDEAIKLESEEYGDIVWADFLDTYQNLTRKSTMGIHWAASRCPQADFVVKLDVDMFANYDVVREYEMKMLRDRRQFDRFAWQGWCMTYVPLRQDSRNIVSFAEWPGSYYPNYASGPAYMYHRDAIPHLLEGLYRIAPQPIEDMHIGTIDTMMGFKCNPFEHVWADADDTKIKDPCAVLLAARGRSQTMRLVDAWVDCQVNVKGVVKDSEELYEVGTVNSELKISAKSNGI